MGSHRSRLLALAALAALALPGCLPIIVATPPMRVTGTLGSPVNGSRPRLRGAARGTIQPLGVLDVGGVRVLDAGLGWGVQGYFDYGEVVHGPVFEAGFFQPITDETRWFVMGRGQLLNRNGFGSYIDGFGAGLQVGAEFFGWSDSVSSLDCTSGTDGGYCGIGTAYGEGGIGLFVDLDIERVAGTQALSASLGLSFRIPASAHFGVAFTNPIHLIGALLR